LSLHSDDLQKLSALYLKPFFEQTALEGITFAGTINADFSIVQDSLTALTATVNKFTVKDVAGRIKVESGAGTINWSNDETFNQPQRLHGGNYSYMPCPSAFRASFLSRASSFKCLKKPGCLFGRVIAINQLGWQAKKQEDPEITLRAA